MANFIEGFELRKLLYGSQVQKTGLALPQNGTGTIATITGGGVHITSLIGQVAVATGSTAVTVALGIIPSSGTSESNSIATAGSVTSLEAGTYIAAPATLGGALQVGGHAGNPVTETASFVVGTGAITWTTAASDGGTINWYITYVPVDTGAYVS